MMGWVRRVFGHHGKREDEQAVADAVDNLEVRSHRVAAEAADRLLDRELRLAYQSMLGDRRHQDVGREPERRRRR